MNILDYNTLQRELDHEAHELDLSAHAIHEADPLESAYQAGVAAGKGYAAMKIRAVLRHGGYEPGIYAASEEGWCTCGAGEYQPPECHAASCVGSTSATWRP